MKEVLRERQKEREPEPTDCVVVLGRGIEQVDTSAGKQWKPTRSIERLTDKGQHQGAREKGLDSEAAGDVVIAGANANVLASLQLFKEFNQKGKPPHLFIFAAGRPSYLENDPDKTLTEGKILAEKFADRAEAEAKVEFTILDKNKNTKDDIVESLRLAFQRGLKSATFITISLHIARAEEFLKMAYNEYPELRAVTGRFVASEDLLMRRYADNPSAYGLFIKGLENLKKSAAWERTEQREKKGLEDLRSGEYR